MLTKKLALIALSLAASAPVFANPPQWAPANGWRGAPAHGRHEHRPVVRYYPVAPVVVRPYVAPRYVYAPPPVIHRPAPTFSIRFDLPL